MSALPYPPPWQDTVTLAAHLSVSTRTIDNWVAQGILPPPRSRGGKRLWKWSEVDERLSMRDGSPETLADRIRNGTRQTLNSGTN